MLMIPHCLSLPEKLTHVHYCSFHVHPEGARQAACDNHSYDTPTPALGVKGGWCSQAELVSDHSSSSHVCEGLCLV